MVSQKKTEERLRIAKILRSHGIKGELKISPENPQGLLLDTDTEVVVVDRFDHAAVMHVESIRRIPQGGILKLRELNDRTAAQIYTNGYVTIERNRLKPLPEDEFYVTDLIGFDVLDESGKPIGQLSNVLTMPAHDLYEIDCGGEKKLIPAVREFIKKIDMKKKAVIIQVIPGLLD